MFSTIASDLVTQSVNYSGTSELFFNFIYELHPYWLSDNKILVAFDKENCPCQNKKWYELKTMILRYDPYEVDCTQTE